MQNVTAASARKLWSYAITQYLTHPVDPAAVTWWGEFGLWKAERRAKKLRYDLALRQEDAPGGLRVFYGVTEDGMTGPWAHFLKAEVTDVVDDDSDDEAEENPRGEVEAAPKAKAGDGVPAVEAGVRLRSRPRPRLRLRLRLRLSPRLRLRLSQRRAHGGGSPRPGRG